MTAVRGIFVAIFVLLVIGGGGLAFPPSASATEERPTLLQLEKEVMCPTCNSTLELSHAPIADRIRAFIVERIEAGDSKSEIKGQARRAVRRAHPCRTAEERPELACMGLPVRGYRCGRRGRVCHPAPLATRQASAGLRRAPRRDRSGARAPDRRGARATRPLDGRPTKSWNHPSRWNQPSRSARRALLASPRGCNSRS